MNKTYYKRLIFNAEVRITQIITSGVLNRASKRDVMSHVRDEINKLKFLNDLERHEMWLWATSFYRHTVAGAARKTEPDARADAIYRALRNETPALEHVKNDIANNLEFRKKHLELRNLLDSDYKFYYCTAHKNPAEGHAAYQGKIYYRKDKNYSKAEEKFINDHELLSVEEVIMEPVWLTTRRNCRHKFIPISFDAIKSGAFNEERNATYMSYSESQYRNYFDRYKMIKAMKKQYDNGGVKIPLQLKTDLKRTRELVISWYRAYKGK